jgi:hypothetical protein
MKRVTYFALQAISISIMTLTGSVQADENLLINGGFEDEPNYGNNTISVLVLILVLVRLLTRF